MKNLILLGSTGSIGKNTLEVVRNNPDKLKIMALSCRKNWELLADQALEFNPEVVVLFDKSNLDKLEEKLSKTQIKVLTGLDGLLEICSYKEADTVLSAVVGAIGLKPIMAAIESQKTICLANKETLVVGGSLVTEAAKRNNVDIIPVESEHSAIFQCLNTSADKNKNLKKVIITASGGPFRNWNEEELANVSLEQALKHPNWNMGGKITIDSATLMNKGLEVIEAHWLFDVAYENIEVVVHPQSIIHSLVEFSDNSVLAQLGWPDMKLPIQYALSYPSRWEEAVESLDLFKVAQMTFEKPRYDAFPCLKYAFEAGRKTGIMPCVLNAANEEAVSAFFQKRINFLDIARVVRKSMDNTKNFTPNSIEELIDADEKARKLAKSLIKKVSEL
jgi:1-deoxy-D-xylulose-5-phosphate reductoisomerase